MADAWVTYPGVLTEAILGCTYSRAHGISPGTVRLDVIPHDTFEAKGGDLVFYWAPAGTTLTLQKCKIDRVDVELTDKGPVWHITIFDKRWMWAFGSISGEYNTRDDKDKLQREKTPKELCELLLKAMGEANGSWDIEDVPDDLRPVVEWDAEVPAEALADLCDEIGCRVCLRWDNTVAIKKIGEGELLPTDASYSPLVPELTLDIAERPDKLICQAGPNLYECDLELEAVGEDTDKKVKPIDDLSYKPADGWTIPDPKFLFIEDEKKRELAQKSVWRWYRVVCSESKPITLVNYNSPGVDPPGDTIDDLRMILPIDDHMLDTGKAFSADDTKEQRKPAEVYGVWGPSDHSYRNKADTVDPSKVAESKIDQEKFTIDREKGIVKFSEQVYRNDYTTGSTPTGLTIKPAKLRLRTAVSVRFKETWGWARYERTRELTGGQDQPPPIGTKPRYIKHEEIVYRVRPKYASGDSFTITGVEDDNLEEIRTEANYYLDAAQKEYEDLTPATMQYGGLQYFELDGAISQITLRVGGGQPMTTTVSRNDDQRNIMPGYKLRRQLERQRKIADLAKKAGTTATKRRIKR